MQALLAFTIAALGLLGLGWAVFKRPPEESRNVITIAFAIYCLILALGVSVYGAAALRTIKGGPGGVEISMEAVEKKIEQTGDRVATDVVAKIRSDVEQLKVSLKEQSDNAKSILDRLEFIQARTTYRTLSGSRKDAFVRELRTIQKPGRPVRLLCASSESESIQFANDVRTALLEANWNVQGPEYRQNLPLSRQIIVVSLNPGSPRDDERVLRSAFEKSRYAAVVQAPPPRPLIEADSELVVMIGPPNVR